MSHIIYPGSFDPITNGHLDIIMRLKASFESVTVLIAHSSQKNHLFTVDERKKLIIDIFKSDKKVIVDSWEGLLVDYLEKKKKFLVAKGLRSIKDFEYELDMAYTNFHLNQKVDTFFIPARSDLGFVSSTLVKEVSSLGGDVSKFVPDNVAKALYKKNK